MANRLELTWYGKDEPIRVEPRLLIENTELLIQKTYAEYSGLLNELCDAD